MSKIKNGRLDQYVAEPFEQQQFGTAGVGRVKLLFEKRQRFCISGRPRRCINIVVIRLHKAKVLLNTCVIFFICSL